MASTTGEPIAMMPQQPQSHSIAAAQGPIAEAIAVPSSNRLRVICGAVLLAALACAAYWSEFPGSFILDDDNMVTENPLTKSPDGWYRLWFSAAEHTDFCYWPVTSTAFWIEWRLWGTNPTGYHAASLALHIIDALLIWLVLQQLSIPGAYLAALLFAVHPVNVESVAWIVQQKNLLAMLFGLLSAWFFLKSDAQRFDGWYWLSLFAFALAMLSKTSVATLPLILLLIVWWLHGQIYRWDLVKIAPFIGVAIALTTLTLWFQNHDARSILRSEGIVDRLLGAGAVVWFYLDKAFLPIDLNFVYPQWSIQSDKLLWWLPLIATVTVTAVLWWKRDTSWGRPLFFAWSFFCLALAPAMGFVDAGYMKFSLVADHYQHLALIAVVALIAVAWSNVYQREYGKGRAAITALAAAGVVALAFLTHCQAALYSNAIKLYESTLKKNPTCWLAENNLGIAWAKTGQYEKAIQCFKLAIQFNPDDAEAYYNWGNALLNSGRPEEAIERYQQSLQIQPASVGPLYNLGNALLDIGQFAEAISRFEEALKWQSDFPEAHLNLGIALASVGRLREAVEHFQRAIELKPDSVESYFNLAKTYAMMRRPADSIAAAHKALELAKSRDEPLLTQQIELLLNSYRPSETPSTHE